MLPQMLRVNHRAPHNNKTDRRESGFFSFFNERNRKCSKRELEIRVLTFKSLGAPIFKKSDGWQKSSESRALVECAKDSPKDRIAEGGKGESDAGYTLRRFATLNRYRTNMLSVDPTGKPFKWIWTATVSTPWRTKKTPGCSAMLALTGDDNTPSISRQTGLVLLF